MDTFLRDVRHALRSLRRTPGFTVAAVLILALGIGISTAMFTVFKTVLVDRLPITAQDRVVVMHTLDRAGRNLDAPATYLPEIERDSALFRGVAGVYHVGAVTVPFADGSVSIPLAAALATSNYFDVLGMRPALGRFFRPEDGGTGAPPVVVLSYAAWRRDFAGDPWIIDRTLVRPGLEQRVRVIGVAPAGFAYPIGADAWLPAPRTFAAQVDIVARLATDVSVSAARAGLLALTRVSPVSFGTLGSGEQADRLEISGVAAQMFADTVLGGARPAIVILSLAVALLLLIACVNIGNLMLVRLLDSARDIAVRRALGATPGDVLRLFGAQTAVLGTVGCALGLLTAVAALRIVGAMVPAGLPRAEALGSIGVPLTIAVATSLFAMLLYGVVPSVLASRASLYAALRSDSRSGTESRSGRRVRHSLVATQVALAVVMLSGAGLLVRTLSRLESMDLGYEPDHLTILSLVAPQSSLASEERAFEMARQLVDRIEATPGAVAASPIEQDPFNGQASYVMKVARADQPVEERLQNPFLPFELVGGDYFRTFQIPIVRGRGFDAGDTKGSGKVVVINESLARQLWPGEEALGQRLVPTTPQAGVVDTPFTVVGIAQDTRFRDLKGVGPVVYFDWDQIPPWWGGILAVRTTRPLAAMLPALRAATHEVQPNLVIWKARSMDQLLAAPLARPRFSALLMAGFSLVALLLFAIGLYGVLASGVARQTHEIGVRIALGATPITIRRLVLRQVVGIVGIGATAGLAVALAGSRLLQSLLYQVSPTDPLTLAGVCVILLAVATLAAYLPVRRAMRVDPVEALRAE